jgi:glycerol-3-phosphate dehydrogenase (NAD(P)+)
VRAAVVGAGSWGTGFSRLLADRGHEVTLVCRDPAQAEAIAETGRNPRAVGDVDLDGVDAVSEAPSGADLYVLAVPSASFSEVVARLPDGGPVLSLTKGLDPSTGGRLSTLVRDRPVAVLSGPNMAEEVAAGLPSAAVIASEDEELAVELQHGINSTVFRVYVNSDVVGTTPRRR